MSAQRGLYLAAHTLRGHVPAIAVLACHVTRVQQGGAVTCPAHCLKALHAAHVFNLAREIAALRHVSHAHSVVLVAVQISAPGQVAVIGTDLAQRNVT